MGLVDWINRQLSPVISMKNTAGGCYRAVDSDGNQAGIAAVVATTSSYKIILTLVDPGRAAEPGYVHERLLMGAQELEVLVKRMPAVLQRKSRSELVDLFRNVCQVSLD